jgi:hypothetical protein
MSAKETYECRKCHRRAEAETESIPECCGQAMVLVDPLPVCGVSPTAEHSRLEDDGEPCDDGRSGLR